MTDEVEELHEAAERAKERKELAPVSFTMAILAVLVATVTLLGHRAHTEEILAQTACYRSMELLPGQEHAPQQSRGAG